MFTELAIRHAQADPSVRSSCPFFDEMEGINPRLKRLVQGFEIYDRRRRARHVQSKLLIRSTVA